jgi:hypothetical protein
MCLTEDCYRPPSKSGLGIFQIIELIIMAVCGILCAAELIDIFNAKERVGNVYLILIIVADVFVVIGLIFVIWGLFCGTSTNIRTGIVCFVVGCLCLVVKTILYLVNGYGISAWELIHFILLIFISYILWVQASRL